MSYQWFQNKNTNIFIQVKTIHIKDNISEFKVFKISIESHPGNICNWRTTLCLTYKNQQKTFQTICKIHIPERLNSTWTSKTRPQQEL